MFAHCQRGEEIRKRPNFVCDETVLCAFGSCVSTRLRDPEREKFINAERLLTSRATRATARQQLRLHFSRNVRPVKSAHLQGFVFSGLVFLVAPTDCSVFTPAKSRPKRKQNFFKLLFFTFSKICKKFLNFSFDLRNFFLSFLFHCKNQRSLLIKNSTPRKSDSEYEM